MAVEAAASSRKRGTYTPSHHALSGVVPLPELASEIAYMHAPAAFGTKTEEFSGEFPHTWMNYHPSAPIPDMHSAITATHATYVSVARISPHIEAQKRRELEWLEKEEKNFENNESFWCNKEGRKIDEISHCFGECDANEIDTNGWGVEEKGRSDRKFTRKDWCRLVPKFGTKYEKLESLSLSLIAPLELVWGYSGLCIVVFQ
jgi:hypothetical protein